MVLKPITVLSTLLFSAFALLLVSILSAPIIKEITLGKHEGISFGVFGFCIEGAECSGISIGYQVDSLEQADFKLPGSARVTISKLLIVHPIAALFTLIVFFMSIAAHFRGPKHSTRFLLVMLIMVLPAFLLSLLSFLVDLLLFVPHLHFGTWLVLAATICIAIAGIASCALRRSIVNRNYNKKRVAEAAELHGLNGAGIGGATRSPVRNNDDLPQFATFEVETTKEPMHSTNSPSPEIEPRIPVNPRQASPRPQGQQQPPHMGGVLGSGPGTIPNAGNFTRTGTNLSQNGRDPYMAPARMGPNTNPNRMPSNRELNHQVSNTTIGSASSGPYGPPRMVQGPPNAGPYGRPGRAAPGPGQIPQGPGQMGMGGPPPHGGFRNGPPPMGPGGMGPGGMGPGGMGPGGMGPGGMGPGGPRRGPPPPGQYGPGPGPNRGPGGPYGPGPGMDYGPPRRQPSPGNMGPPRMGPGMGPGMGPRGPPQMDGYGPGPGPNYGNNGGYGPQRGPSPQNGPHFQGYERGYDSDDFVAGPTFPENGAANSSSNLVNQDNNGRRRISSAYDDTNGYVPPRANWTEDNGATSPVELDSPHVVSRGSPQPVEMMGSVPQDDNDVPDVLRAGGPRRQNTNPGMGGDAPGAGRY